MKWLEDFKRPLRNSGDFLKRLTAILLVLGILVVLIFLVKDLAPIGKKVDKLKNRHDHAGWLTSESYIESKKELDKAAGAVWLNAGKSVVILFVGCAAMYAFGDIADNVWIMTYASDEKRKKSGE